MSALEALLLPHAQAPIGSGLEQGDELRHPRGEQRVVEPVLDRGLAARRKS